MHIHPEPDDDMSHSNCGCGNCDAPNECDYKDDDVYDDPYDVIMYDIDTESDDLYALIEMLNDSARSWYARRRLNALAASGPLSALVAAIIIDSLGRRWNPLEHPRDRFGRFINTGGFFRWMMNGKWLRGQVARIDSDGVIHARSVGNDGMPDGSVLKFKPDQTSKLISVREPKSKLSAVEAPDLDADIPDFPEASSTQRRIYNALQIGDMPAEDLDVYRSAEDRDLEGEDFADQLKGLQDRGLLEIETGDAPRARRNDDADLGITNLEDTDIDDVPDDETPDIEDSPALTKAQRDLLDRLVEADRGEGDGVSRDELSALLDEGGDVNDLDALIEGGMVEEDGDGRLFLENPEGEPKADIDAPAETDITTEIFDAAAEVSDDSDVQEAFQHYAEELARPGNENNASAPEGLSAAKMRNAEAAANKWWEDRNGGTAVDEDVLDQREADDFADQDVPEAETTNPKDALNPRNQALADALMSEEFEGEEYAEFLESDEGVEYAAAVKRLFDAEDLEENGFDAQAATERFKAERMMRKLEFPTDEDIEGWPLAVQNMRNADAEQPVVDDGAEIVDDVLETDVPEVDVPEADAAELLRQAVRSDDGQAELLDPSGPDQIPEPAIEETDTPDVIDEQMLPEEAVEEPNPEFDIPEAARDNTDTDILPDDVPEDLVDEPQDVSFDEEKVPEDAPTWQQHADRMNEEGKADEFYARLDQENRIAEELGLDILDEEDAPWSWQILAEQIGYRPTELLFNDSDGSIGEALLKDPADYTRQYEDELLQKFQDEGDIGVDIIRLRQAGLVESDSNNQWQLSQDGWKRLGLPDNAPEETVDGPLDVDERIDVGPDPILDGDLDVPEADVPETPSLNDVPETDVPEDLVPETDEDLPNVDLGNLDTWVEWQKRFNDERDLDGDINDGLVKEAAIANELGLDLFAGNGLVNWNNFVQTVDPDVADALYRKHDGSIGPASMDYIANRDNWDARFAPDDVDTPEPDDINVPEPGARPLDDNERDLLNRIDNGGQAKRSERALEDALIDEGILEEDDNGDSRLTDAGRAALGVDDATDEVADEPVDIDQILEEEEAIANAPDDTVVPDDTAVPDAAPLPGNDDVSVDAADDTVVEDEEPADNAAPTDTTNAFPAPTLPDPANPNDATPGFRKISGAGGLNAGGTYEVTEDNGPLKVGDRVYIKNGRSREHAQNEILANRLYNLAGVDAPEVIEGSTGDRIASRIIDDLHELDVHDPADASVLGRVRDEFVIDAWIANWDGMNPGNTLVTPDGTPYRIDVGSAMEYRAQGGLKGAAFGNTVSDIDTLRDLSTNYYAAKVFGSMSDDDVAASAQRLAQINPDDIRQTIATSNLPDKDALADKMIARRESVLQRFGISDPFGGDGSDSTVDTTNGISNPSAVNGPPVPLAASGKVFTDKQIKSQQRFATRTNPTLEVSYSNGNLIMPDGSELDYDIYYRSGAGGEAKIGKVTETLDQERFPGWVKMEFLDGTEQSRHVLGTGTGSGGLRVAGEPDIEKWERQTSVTGESAEIFDYNDYPMSDGLAPLPGSRVVFDMGGEEQFGAIMYINPKQNNGGKAHIVPEGGGPMIERPVRLIRAQTQQEIDSDAGPLVPYKAQKVVAQYLPQPRYTQDGTLLSRMDKPVNLGDWMSQRAGGDGLVGEVVDIPDQNLWPGWVTLRFPDGEERSRHVEGFTEVGKMRGAGGLQHAVAPDADTWTRQRRVVGEEGEVLSYDFSTIPTLDGTLIKVGEEVFGTDRKGSPVFGLLIRINPHLKRNGITVPTGFVWQDGKEVTVDVSKITNTVPPVRPTPRARRVTSFTSPPTPSNVRTTPTPRPAAPSTTPSSPTSATPAARQAITRPEISPNNTVPAYTPNKGAPLTDDEIAELDIDPSRLATSNRTNGTHHRLAAIYEAQDFDALPLVVDQTEAERLTREEGYVPILRSVRSGTDRAGMNYDDAYRYGSYFAGDGIHGYGSYFAYGTDAISESTPYGNRRIYALVRPSDLKTIDKWDLTRMQLADLRSVRSALSGLDSSSPEYKTLRKKERLYNDLGEYGAAMGYDAITVRHGNGNYDNGPFPDENLSDWGYLVLLNRSATVAVDTYFEDSDDIFRNGFPQELAPSAVTEVV